MLDPLDLAHECAAHAGTILLDRFGSKLEIARKATHADLVTDVDRASEAAIVERIRAASPTATIVGEEGGIHVGSGPERWYIDPLDGTTNYAHAHPTFCVSIACEREGELVAAVVHAPVLSETFAARRGGGATRNGTPIHVSQIARVNESLVCTGFAPTAYHINAHYFAAVSRLAQAVRRDGSAALDLAYVAAGRYDAFWEWGLASWDVAAGILLVREAGGRVTAIDGSPPLIGGGSILASNDQTHGEMLAILESGRE